jgi:hypothetical protein
MVHIIRLADARSFFTHRSHPADDGLVESSADLSHSGSLLRELIPRGQYAFVATARGASPAHGLDDGRGFVCHECEADQSNVAVAPKS